jgi:uncharacterized protein with HEPN domain
MTRAETDRLRDIIDAMNKAEKTLGGLTFDTFQEDDTLFAALCHYALVVSEASRHVSDEHKNAYPNIDWRAIADTGNFIRHVYFRVSAVRLWHIYEKEFPMLRPVIEELIRKLDADHGEQPDPHALL